MIIIVDFIFILIFMDPFYKGFIVVLFLSGLMLVIGDLVRAYKQCPLPKTIYRFIPRTFKEEQESPIPVSEIYVDLFEKPSPWVSGYGTFNTRSQLNQFFISQD